MIRSAINHWLDRDIQTKAASASSAHQVLIGTKRNPFLMSFEQARPRLTELVKRYGRWVQRCVDINAGTAASVEPRLFSIGQSDLTLKSLYLRPKAVNARTKAFFRGQLELQPGSVAIKKIQGMTDDMVEITDHPFLTLMDDVNPWEEGYAFRYSQYADLQIFGRYYTLLAGEGEPPTEMWRLLPQRVKVIRDAVDFVGGYEYGFGADKQTFAVDEVLWHKLFDPTDPWGGKGPLESWLKAIDADFAIEAFQEWLFARGGTPDYVIKHKAVMTSTQKSDFLAEWRRKFGELARRVTNIAFLQVSDPLDDIKRLGETNRELEFTKSQQAKRDEVCQAFGVPKALVTADDINRANAREASPTHMRYTVYPMIQRNQDVINQRLLPRWSDRLVLIHDNPIPEDRQIRIQERRSLLDSGGTINEAREADGLEPLDDPKASEPLVGAGFQLVSQIGEQSFGLFGGGGGGGRRDGDNDGLINEGGKSLKTTQKVLPHGTSNGSIVSHAKLWLEYYAGQVGMPLCCGVVKGLENIPGETFDTGLFITEALAKFSSEVREFLRGQYSEIAQAMKDTGASGVSMLLEDERFTRDLVRVIRPSVGVAIEQGGKRGMNKLPGAIDFNVESIEVQQFIDEYTVRLARAVNGTTELALREIMVDGQEQNRSVHEIANAIMELDDRVSGGRAQRIARTESTRAFVEGEKEAWRQSGVVQGKTWLLAPNACEFCRALKAQFGNKAIPLDQPFYSQGHVLVGVEGGRLRLDYSDVFGPPLHPHDRCDLLPVLVEGS